MEGENKGKVGITIYFTPEEKEYVDSESKKEYSSISGWIKRRILKEFQEGIEEAESEEEETKKEE